MAIVKKKKRNIQNRWRKNEETLKKKEEKKEKRQGRLLQWEDKECISLKKNKIKSSMNKGLGRIFPKFIWYFVFSQVSNNHYSPKIIDSSSLFF